MGKNTKQTSAKVAKVASKILRDGRYSPSAKGSRQRSVSDSWEKTQINKSS